MPITVVVFLFAIPIFSLQIALCTFSLVKNHQARLNQIFSALMLSLAAGVFSIMLIAIQPPFSMTAVAAWIQVAAICSTTLFLALFLLELLVPEWKYTRLLQSVAVVIWAGSLLLLVVDLFLPTAFVYQLDASMLDDQYLFLSEYLQGAVGSLVYGLNVKYAHLIFPVLLIILLISGVIEKGRRSTAVNLLIASFLLFAVNFVVWWVEPRLVSLIGSLSIALIAAWFIFRFHMLSPVAVGMRQALETAVFGVLVFDAEWQLLEFNLAAQKMLPLHLERKQSLLDILQQLSEKASNQEGVQKFIVDFTQSFAQDRTLGVILDDHQNSEKRFWLHFQFSPINIDNKSAGYLCTIENQTAVRQAQDKLQAVNESLENFAFQATLLNDMIRTAISDVEYDVMMKRFADRLGDMFGAVGCYITTWDDERKQVVPAAAYGVLHDTYVNLDPPTKQPTATKRVLDTGRPLIVENIAESPFSYYFEQENFVGSSMMVVPLISGNLKIGAVFIVFAGKHRISQEEISLGVQAARQISLAISKTLILEAEREQRKLAETLREINLILTSTLDIKEILDLVLEYISQVIPFDTASVTFLENGKIKIAQVHGFAQFTEMTPDQIFNEEFSLKSTATYAQMSTEKRPLLISDTSKYEGWLQTAATEHIKSWIGVPLLVDDEVRAFLTVDKIDPDYYQETHKERLNTFGNQVAIALQRAQWYENSRRWTHQLATLNDLSAQMVGLVDEDELIELVISRLRQDFNYDNVVAFLIDDQNQSEMVLMSMAGAYIDLIDMNKEYRVSVHEGLMGLAVTQQDYVLVNDTKAESNFYQLPGMDIQSEIVVPIRTKESVLGVLNVDSRSLNAFNEQDVYLLTIVADQLAVALQKARLFAITDRRAKELEILSVTSAKLRSAHTTAEMLNIILENSVYAVSATVAVVLLIADDRQAIVSRGVYPWGAYPIGLKHRFDQGITGYVARTGNVYIASNYEDDAYVDTLEGEEEFLENIVCSLSLPLQTENKIIGVLHIGFAEAHLFTDQEIQLMTSIVDISANALYRVQIVESLEERVEQRTQELQDAYSRLKELDKLKSKFISDVTHELRTPVANLNLYLDLIKMGKPENRERYMAVVENQAARLTQIVENTMQMPQLDSDNDVDVFQPVDMKALITTAVAAFEAKAQAKNIELTCDVSSDLHTVSGDKKQLEQVVRKILANAVNYTFTGKVSVVGKNDHQAGVICIVQDSGFGIEPEDLPYIFDRFYRGRKVGQSNIPGMGLGLALAKEIISLHHGRIEIQSQPNAGTECLIWLPAIVPDAKP